MNSAALRSLIIYAVILPLAIFVGWMAVDLANWDRTSFTFFAAILFLLTVPFLLKWHYPAMVMSWHASMTIFFLPGKPEPWMLLAGVTFGLAILQRILQKRPAFLSAPSITLSLVALLGVVVLTGVVRGGFGLRALGASTYGGKASYYIIAAIIGYFAMASQHIPISRAKFYVALFFLPGMIPAISTLIYYAGPSFYSLYLIFPVAFAGVQAMSEYSGSVVRVVGFSVGACAFAFYVLTAHGVRAILQKWHWFLLMLLAVVLGSFGGYRSFLILLGTIFMILFITEGLLRSPVFPALLLVGALLFALLIPVGSKLPLSVQRTLSFLPLKLDPNVVGDAAGSLEWRLQMWRALVPDLPKYIWIGKGFALNPTDMYLMHEASRRGRVGNYAEALASGGYHSGPLTTYVPLGGLGCLAFAAFLTGSLRVLYLNYRYGDPELRTINRGLFAYFLGSVIFFLFFFGGFGGDLFKFTGAIGLSVALNNGVCRKPAVARQNVRFGRNLELGATQAGVA